MRRQLKIVLSPPVAALFLLVATGSAYRYLRIVASGIDYLPYLFELFLWVLVALAIATKRRLIADRIDFLILLSLVFATISFALLSMRNGVTTQLVFFATYGLPLSIYFYVKTDARVNVTFLDTALKIFTVSGVLLILVEFYSINYIGTTIFDFASYWEGAGVDGFHASTAEYAFLGQKNRPWGLMAMPQSSGSVFAALAIYFLAKFVFSTRDSKRRSTLIYFAMCVLAVYLSGSRTAVVVIALMITFIFRDRIGAIFIAGLLGATLVATFVITAETSLSGYSNIIPRFIEGVTINSLERTTDFLFGQGLNSIAGRVIIGVDEIHLLNHLFYAGIFMYTTLAAITIILLRTYLGRLSKHPTVKELQGRREYYMANILLIFSLILGALHYDPLMRYPSNAIVLSALAIMSRDGLFSVKRSRS